MYRMDSKFILEDQLTKLQNNLKNLRVYNYLKSILFSCVFRISGKMQPIKSSIGNLVLWLAEEYLLLEMRISSKMQPD